ncbi:MAG: type II toxin-antitoxin system death-on-curing family toxin [Hyphomicrobiales bacterium]|nr:type II toxin-antitoxin system death-on-curing family toxin [Hyphomicrobiales bacterium]
MSSALARPRHCYIYDGERDILWLAVSLLAAIVQNHPFEQGNKRTAFLAALIFLNKNGYDLTFPDENAKLADLVLGLAAHTKTEPEGVDALRAYIVEFDPPDGAKAR